MHTRGSLLYIGRARGGFSLRDLKIQYVQIEASMSRVGISISYVETQSDMVL